MSRVAGGLQPWIDLNADSLEPLYRQLYESLRGAIVGGRIRRGMRLPSTRTLAQELGLSRTTTLTAYRQLRAEGYLVGEVGSGSYVCDTLPEDTEAAPASTRNGGSYSAASLPARHQAPLPLTPGVPSSREFPWKQWRRLTVDAHAALRHGLFAGVDDRGLLELRQQIAAYVATTRGASCSADQVVITTGTRQALAAATLLLTSSGDRVVVEEPCWAGVRQAVQTVGASCQPVGVDQDGLLLERLHASTEPVALICCHPGHHFPLGHVMSEERRLQLLEFAADRDAYIVEAEYDSDFRHEGQPVRALIGMDRGERVLHIGSFSMTLFPSLRLGYAIVPSELTAAFADVRDALGGMPSAESQIVTAAFMASGQFAAHLRRMRLVYGRRRDILLDVLRRECGDGVAVGPSQVGTYLHIEAAAGLRGGELNALLRQNEVGAVGMNCFHTTNECTRGVIAGYSGASDDDVQAAATRLARCLLAPRPEA